MRDQELTQSAENDRQREPWEEYTADRWWLAPSAENDATRAAREAGLPHCPQCGDMAHLPGKCACQNMALGRCICPEPGFERGVPSHMARVTPPEATER